MTVKRRTVWFSDQDWADIASVAKEAGMSPAQFVQASSVGSMERLRHPEANDGLRVTDAEAAAIGQTIRAAPSFNTRPFTPVPKKG